MLSPVEAIKSKLPVMTSAELIKARQLTIDIIYKARKNKDEAKIQALQDKLAKSMGDRWQVEAKRAIGKMDRQVLRGSGKFKESDKKKMLKIAESFLSDFGDMFKKEIEKTVEQVYQIGKNKFFKTQISQVTKAKAKGKMTAADFVARDEALVAGVADQYKVAVNVFYEENLSETLVNLIDDVMFDGAESLAKADAYEEIISRLQRHLGLDDQSLSGLKPPGFTGTARQYFTNEIQTTVTRARSWGNISALQEAEVTEYVIVNPDPISEICQMMNGRVFKTETAIKQMGAMLDAETPDELAEVTPWVSDLEDFGVTKDNMKLDDEKTNIKIQESGLAAPPYHSKCKSDIEIFIR
jgi:hypothetical protein